MYIHIYIDYCLLIALWFIYNSVMIVSLLLLFVLLLYANRDIICFRTNVYQ